jgi:Kef-type K+ transport system membrane component KefB
MARNDPTDTGGLFIGRRPGTAPLHYRAAPETGGSGRRRTDALLAAVVLAAETVLCLSLWGPQPAGWLWVGSQVDYWTKSVTAGIAVAFAGMIGTLMFTLGIASRLDRLWRLLRRAAGHDQREGMLGRIFSVTAIVAGAIFLFWFVIIQGPGPTFSSTN